MKTRAVRLYGKKDLRLEEFELPQIKDNEILAKVICDSLCMSSYKAASQGSDHKRIPNDCDVKPVIIGHGISGENAFKNMISIACKMHEADFTEKIKSSFVSN